MISDLPDFPAIKKWPRRYGGSFFLKHPDATCYASYSNRFLKPEQSRYESYQYW